LRAATPSALDAADRADAASGDPDSVDGSAASVERELDFATRSLLLLRTRRLAHALERVMNGTYGTCEECGEPIAPKRLAAMPEVTTCVTCQSRRERRDAVRARRASVESAFDEVTSVAER
jgi:DnaK suppressor protein